MDLLLAPFLGGEHDELDLELLHKIREVIGRADYRHASDAPVALPGIVVRKADWAVRNLGRTREKPQRGRTIVGGADDENAALAGPWSDREHMTQPERERARTDEQYGRE